MSKYIKSTFVAENPIIDSTGVKIKKSKLRYETCATGVHNAMQSAAGKQIAKRLFNELCDIYNISSLYDKKAKSKKYLLNQIESS